MMVRSYQKNGTNINTGFLVQLLKNRKELPINNNGGLTSPITEGRPKISSRLDRKPLKKHNSLFAGEWSSVGSIGEVSNPIVKDRTQIDSWPDWKTLEKHESISTVNWLRDKWGADGTYDLPHPDWKRIEEGELNNWIRSEDPLVRIVGQICYLYYDYTETREGLRNYNNQKHSRGILKKSMQQATDSGFWYDNNKSNRPGEEIDEINWNDVNERAHEANSRFEWLKKNWAPYDIKMIKEQNKIHIVDKYWQMMSNFFPNDHKNSKGIKTEFTQNTFEKMFYSRDGIWQNLYTGYDPGMEAYFKYLDWILRDVFKNRYGSKGYKISYG